MRKVRHNKLDCNIDKLNLTIVDTTINCNKKTKQTVNTQKIFTSHHTKYCPKKDNN